MTSCSCFEHQPDNAPSKEELNSYRYFDTEPDDEPGQELLFAVTAEDLESLYDERYGDGAFQFLPSYVRQAVVKRVKRFLEMNSNNYWESILQEAIEEVA